MDLNYLLARQQVSLMQAERAASAPSRIAHCERAKSYAVLANALMAELGAGATIGKVTQPGEPIGA